MIQYRPWFAVVIAFLVTAALWNIGLGIARHNLLGFLTAWTFLVLAILLWDCPRDRASRQPPVKKGSEG